MYSLGIDIGSSSIKVALLDIESGRLAASSTNPSREMPISAPQKGFAEQDPEMWWKYVCEGIHDLASKCNLAKVKSIGVTYQMHGLVAVDKQVCPLRDAIIWCDSRAVAIGARAFGELSPERCLDHLLNSPGNFTASKLTWVKENQPEIYGRIWKFMLPGDYVVYKLTGEVSTTETGLSEQILWDFRNSCRADFVAEHFGIDTGLIPDIAPSIGIAARTTEEFQSITGIPAGIPVSYRAGDQPNNAFSLNVLNPGEIAATGGTSGVVYGVTDVPKADVASRVNTFLHVNNTASAPRLGVLLCINGTGIMNSWVHHNISPENGYAEMNEIAQTAPVGCDGLSVIPFGNGAERVLCNTTAGASFNGLDLVRHNRSHIFRAVQEGIAYSFRYGIDVMKGLGLAPAVIRAGKANLFLNSLFRTTLATLTDARIELFDTDGALGAARGAALGAGIYKSEQEAFSGLAKVGEVEPEPSWKQALEETYGSWKRILDKSLN